MVSASQCAKAMLNVRPNYPWRILFALPNALRRLNQPLPQQLGEEALSCPRENSNPVINPV